MRESQMIRTRALLRYSCIALIAIALLVVASTDVWAQALPPDIQADQYLLAAKKQLEAENYAGAVEYFDKILSLGVKMPTEFYYHYGKTLLKTHKFEESKAALTKYVTLAGRAGKYYTQSLEMLTEAESRMQVIEYEAQERRKIRRREILVEGGTFRMGAEGDRQADEKPVHSVTVSSFLMMETEVTQKDYTSLMGTNPSKFKGDNLPVEQVNWYDAIAYANELSKRDRLRPAYRVIGINVEWDRSADGWRLPTEAEYEYAARGGKKSRGYNFAGGNDPNEVAWHKYNSNNKTNPVGIKAPNELGLYDLCGNVWEWCWDWYGNYESNSIKDPVGPKLGTERTIRSPGWIESYINLYISERSHMEPNARYDFLGFRLVRMY